MKNSILLVVLVVSILLDGGVTIAGESKGKPKSMRVYAAECSDVAGPIREQLEKRDFWVVDEDVDDHGDITLEFMRRTKATKWKSRGLVELNQGDGECTIIVTLEQKNPFFGWQTIDWNEKKFYEPIDAQFAQVE